MATEPRALPKQRNRKAECSGCAFGPPQLALVLLAQTNARPIVGTPGPAAARAKPATLPVRYEQKKTCSEFNSPITQSHSSSAWLVWIMYRLRQTGENHPHPQ